MAAFYIATRKRRAQEVWQPFIDSKMSANLPLWISKTVSLSHSFEKWRHPQPQPKQNRKVLCCARETYRVYVENKRICANVFLSLRNFDIFSSYQFVMSWWAASMFYVISTDFTRSTIPTRCSTIAFAMGWIFNPVQRKYWIQYQKELPVKRQYVQ